jgi:hypothetical protein
MEEDKIDAALRGMKTPFPFARGSKIRVAALYLL